ncbi:MAG TPA: phosphatidate cytidylyltransferase, partial [Burkholderiales bacterium]
MPDFLRRAGTAFVLLALLLAGLFLLPPGGVALMMALIVGIGGFEWARLCGFNPHLYAGLVVGALFALFWLG